MSTVIANNITSIDGDAINTHVGVASEIVTEGGTKAIASNTLTLGLIKEYLTCYLQGQDFLAPDPNTATFNISSVADTTTGTITITHVNNYNAATAYQAYPNTGNYGKTNIMTSSTSSAVMYDHGENNSLSDMVACVGFSGELA